MKLIRFGEVGNEKPGIIDKNHKRKDLSGYFDDWNRSFFQSEGLSKLKKYEKDMDSLPDVDANCRWASCIGRPGKIICIGLNYSDHAREANMPLPSEPIIFQKGSNTIAGPYDNIIIPKKSNKTDWEVELGVIIGKDTRYLDDVIQSKSCIAGYCLANDVSERFFQLECGGQWTKGKSCDNFSPIGPYLLTADEVGDVQNLHMSLKLNGVQMQKGNTANMIFGIYFIVHYLSQFMTLEAGDLILTGTPPGVGMGKTPPIFLKEGDIVELSIELLGFQRQQCVQA